MEPRNTGIGTTVYSTLMLQEPLCDPPRTYIAYVDQDVRLDIIYISEALDAIIGLHDVIAVCCGA